MQHSCSYCDGTLASTRPLCLNCEHPLSGELIPVSSDGQSTFQKTQCPKCEMVNKMIDYRLVIEVYYADPV